jgi:uncharacterized protein involved in exopolysaccharide biosynthesis
VDQSNDGLTPERVLGAVLRRKKLFAATLAASAAAFGAAAGAVPPSYRANVVMTIEPGRYPNDFLRPNVIPGLDTRLGGMEKMLQSAPVIEELRQKTGLAARDGGGGSLDALGLASDPIETWRKAFRFEVLQGLAQGARKSEEAVLVEVSYKHSDPEMAAKVVNACAARANEENNRFRRAFVEEVVRFIQKTEERTRDVTRGREEAWNAFKLANLDRLPEQEPHLAARLSQLRIRYADLKNTERFGDARLEQLTSERGLLVAQVALAVQIASAGMGGDSGERDGGPGELRRERALLWIDLNKAKDELAELEKIYMPRLPQVVLAKDRVARLEARLKDVDAKLAALGLALSSNAEKAPAVEIPKERDLFGPGKDDEKTPGGLRKVPVTIPGNKLDGAPKPDGGSKKDDAKKDDAKKDAKEAVKEQEKQAAPVLAPAKVVDVLSTDQIDEKSIKKALDEFSYRLVVSNPSYSRIRQIDFGLKETKESLKEVTRQREECFGEIKKTEESLAAIPEVRARLEVLGRALLEAREDLRRLADQLENAKKALEVENEGKGEQFRVIDFARPPTKSSGPGRGMFMALALAAAIGFTIGVCLLLEMRPTIAALLKAANKERS